MAKGTNAGSTRPRVAKQNRSRLTRARIETAVIDLLAEKGVSGLRHRDIAKKAGVSLAATTYHYRTKLDLLTDASAGLQRSYVRALHAFVERRRASESPALVFPDFVRRLLHNLTGRDRARTIAWCEIMIACARHPEMRDISRAWFDGFLLFWAEIAALAGRPPDREQLLSLIDHVTGTLFFAIPLGLSPGEVEILRSQGLDAVLSHDPAATIGKSPEGARAQGVKETRDIVLDAAIRLLVTEGAAGVTGRQVAIVAGTAGMIPFYHFKSIGGLLGAARLRLYEIATDRYRKSMAGLDRDSMSAVQLIDATASILQREATQYGDLNLASFSAEMEAVRQPELAGPIRRWALDQHDAWRRLLDCFDYAHRPSDALFAMTMFTGKQIRLLATGTRTADLSGVRREFAAAFDAMLEGTSWI